MNPWLLLDVNFLCHRVRYSMPALTYDGKATGIIYGFLQTVQYLEKQFESNRVVFCFDSRYNLRKDMLPTYKANRKVEPADETKQIFIRDFRLQMAKLRVKYLHGVGYTNIFVQTGYESDDILASIAQRIPKKQTAIIVTADHDLFQCIQGNISVYNPIQRKTTNLQRFYKTYGIKPNQWHEMKAIAGCSSDNIKGVPGVGEKTAIKYLRKEKISGRLYERIEQFKQTIDYKLNLALVTLPLDGTMRFKLKPNKFSKRKWDRLVNKLGMYSLDQNIQSQT